MFKSVSMLAVAAVAGMGVVSCTADKDLYNPEAVEQNVKAEYEANFVKKFGAINPEQSWDMASAVITRFAGDGKATRVAGDTKVICVADAENPLYNDGNWFDIPAQMHKDMNVFLEREDHRGWGNLYAMSIPEESFTIIPLHQGYTGSSYKVHMVVGTGDNAVDYTLWKKGEMMQKKKGNGSWTNLEDKDNKSGAVSYGNCDVRVKAITFTNMPTDQPFYFYVERQQKNPVLYPSSLDGYMMDITSQIEHSSLAVGGKNVRIVGVETQYDYSAFDPAEVPDNDFEDLMFAIVGNVGDIPHIDEYTFEQVVDKRYMIEDLGETDDFDFNDIVVDVTSKRILNFTLNSKTGEITNRNYGPWTDQKATIKHLGGILDFNLTVGDYSFGWMPGELDVDKEISEEITGWDPFENNVNILIKQKNGQNTNSVVFPKKGNVPMIIATHTDRAWMPERHSILDTLKELILGYFGEII